MLDDQKEARPSYQPKARNMQNILKCTTSHTDEARRQTAKELAFLAIAATAFFALPAIMSATKLAGWW